MGTREAPVVQVEDRRVLNHLDRCDKGSCGAQAWVRVYLATDVPWTLFVQFCGHHADEQPDSLFIEAAYVVNERRYILGID